MFVWLVRYGYNDASFIEGIFSTKEMAETVAKNMEEFAHTNVVVEKWPVYSPKPKVKV